MILLFIVLSIFATVFADDSGQRNVITVPPNCPDGQEWINGACRDVWRRGASSVPFPVRNMLNTDIDSSNMVTVPTNCPPGQQLINGQCRDVWRGGDLAYSKLFQKLLESLWANDNSARGTKQSEEYTTKNIISVPNQCPAGYKPDALGICRPIL